VEPGRGQEKEVVTVGCRMTLGATAIRLVVNVALLQIDGGDGVADDDVAVLAAVIQNPARSIWIS
jgi:hypothetical protein